MSTIGKELMSELKKIWNNKDFVCGAMSNAGTEEAWREMLDYINEAKESKDPLTTDEILLLSLDV